MLFTKEVDIKGHTAMTVNDFVEQFTKLQELGYGDVEVRVDMTTVYCRQHMTYAYKFSEVDASTVLDAYGAPRRSTVTIYPEDPISGH